MLPTPVFRDLQFLRNGSLDFAKEINKRLLFGQNLKESEHSAGIILFILITFYIGLVEAVKVDSGKVCAHTTGYQ